MNKLYYYNLSIEEIKKIQDAKIKPKLLLHACCAPCSCFPLMFLSKYFDITIYYNNSNIYPKEEYEIRLNELKSFIQKYYPNVDIIIPKYDYDNYIKDLIPYKDLPELSTRCFICYAKRMDEAYRFANENHYDYFCTVMTISRQKDSIKLNEIGQALSHKYPNTKYFYSYFKKKDGALLGNNIAKSLNMYRQQYCGCEFSIHNKEGKLI